MKFFSYFLRFIPTREQLAKHRATRWLAPWLGQRKLWHFSRRSVALGMAIGIFFGFLLPVAQIPFSAATAVVLRANVPAAMGSTLVTNPITFAPIYYLAWRTGAWLTGHEGAAPASFPAAEAVSAASGPHGAPPPGLWQRIQALGKPLIVGLAVFACAGGLATYALVSLGWRLHVRYKRWRRQPR